MVNKLLIFLIVGVVIFSGMPFIFAQPEEDNATITTSETANVVEVGNKICPVSGEKINEETKVTYEYEGKVYNFCCAMCIDEFKKEPQKYIKKINEELSAKTKQNTDE